VSRRNSRGARLKTLRAVGFLAVPMSVISVAPRVFGQQFNLLHSFGSSPTQDGSSPNGSLLISGSELYGMTYAGGQYGYGTVFEIGTNGNDFNLLHSFADTSTDGAYPWGSLIESGTFLYGMTNDGGSPSPLLSSPGVVFQINTDGSGFNVMHAFTPSTDGEYPFGDLLQSGSNLYGMTDENGGTGIEGTLFDIGTSGSGFSVLHQFTGMNALNWSANDGANPYGSLIESGSSFYGMTYQGGSHNYGTVFQYSPASGVSLLHSFSFSEGVLPQGSLAVSGSTLYGMTAFGGADLEGTIFEIGTNGSGFQVLHEFTGGASDGANPTGSLTVYGTTLLGMTDSGGDGYGGIFEMNIDGSGFDLIHAFTGGATDGASPQGSLSLSGNTVYGMTQAGGAYGKGAVFSYTLPTTNGVWSATGGGSWSAAGNWSGGAIPRLIGDSATFGSSITAPSTVTMDGIWTVGNINFNSASSYTIAAGADAGGASGSINLSNSGADAAITDGGGAQYITAPVLLTSNVTLTVVNSTDSLQLSGPISGSGAVTSGGNGTVVLSGNNTYAGPTTAISGRLVINAAGALPANGTLTIGSATSTGTTALSPGIGKTQLSSLTINPGSTLDVGNNELLINYGTGPDPVSAIASYLQNGRNGGGWDGTGIDSSAVAAADVSGTLIYALAYADGADNVIGGLSSGMIEVVPALAGDAKLTGAISFGDFQILCTNYGKPGGWDKGNFTYQATINFSDFQEFAQNYSETSSLTEGQTSAIQQFAQEYGYSLVAFDDKSGFALVAVPEPASAGILAIAGAALLARRRRRGTLRSA